MDWEVVGTDLEEGWGQEERMLKGVCWSRGYMAGSQSLSCPVQRAEAES